MKMSMMIPVAGLSMLAGGVMGMALSPKKKTKMQKTVSTMTEEASSWGKLWEIIWRRVSISLV